MSDPQAEHDHEHAGHDHSHNGHEHDDHDGHEHDDHDHTLLSDRFPPGDWTVDPEESDVHFSTRALLGIMPVSGVFDSFNGQLHVDDFGVANGTLTIETGSLDTGVVKRDEHLRTAEFLHVEQHPHMVFTVESIDSSGHDHLNLNGTLRIRDNEVKLEFPVYAIAHGDHLHLEGRTVIDHASAGFGWAKPLMISKKVKAQVALTLHRRS